MRCAKCATVQDPLPVILLIGGVHTALCNPCRTAWHAYFLTLPQSDTMRQLQDEYRHMQALIYAKQPPALEAMQAWGQRRDRAERELFALGVAWLQTPSVPHTTGEKGA